MKIEQYDAIVIGSGMGGLTTASILAQLGKKKVLILEKHFKLGGFTHAFRRKRFEWDVGVHYVGQMQDGALARRMMDLVTGFQVRWHRMNKIYERYKFPGKTFEVPEGMNAFRDKLIEDYPAEKAKLEQYFRDVRKAQEWVNHWFIAKLVPKRLASFLLSFGEKLATMTTEDYLSRFEDPTLRAILAAQWPDFGSPPQESAFGFHSTVSADFFDGGFFPIGGAKKIAESVKEVVESNGGSCRVCHEVNEILIRGNRAYGVRSQHKGKIVEFHAPLIISNAGAVNTFCRMVPESHGTQERTVAKRLKRGVSAIIVFVGLKEDPRLHGFDDANYWCYSRLDHDTKAKIADGEPERIDGVFVSFGSLRDPHQTNHTAQIISFSEASEWDRYHSTQWLKRGATYEEHKSKTMEDMLDFTEKSLPGLRNLIEYQEMATPMTVQSFTSHTGGVVYGQPCNADRLTKDQWRIETSIKGLFLTGSDVGTPGVNGAMMGGVMTAAKVLGIFGLPRIMMRAFRSKPPKDALQSA